MSIKRRTMHRESGATIIENLVAISLVAIAAMGSTGLFVSSYEKNQSARNHSSLVPQMRLILDQYRTDFNSALDVFNESYTTITNGEQAQISVNHEASRSTFNLTFTAIRSRDDTPPEAVRINVTATQRGGVRLGERDTVYETVIAQTS